MKKTFIGLLIISSYLTYQPTQAATTKLGNTLEYITVQSSYVLPVVVGLYVALGLKAGTYLSLGFRTDNERNRIILGSLVTLAGYAIRPVLQNVLVNPLGHILGAAGDAVANVFQ